MRKIFVIGGNTVYANWMQGTLVEKLEEADLVVLTGGEDVSPKYYQQPAHKTTYNSPARDLYEIKEARKAIELGIPIIGICRGSQLSCVLAGGDLVQDQPNPRYIHPIKTYDDKEFEITSTHHQAQLPFCLPKEEYKILAWTEKMLGYHKDGWDNEINPEVEVEICFYPKIKALAIQGHPESMIENEPVIKWLQTLLTKHLNNEL